jgi:hypothetical protein
METLSSVRIGWKAVERALNKIIPAVNARGITRGPCILTRESTNGTMISLDLDAVTVLINDAIAAAIAAKKNSNSSANDPTGGNGGGGGGGGGGDIAPGSGPDLGGSGGGAGWSATTPVLAGSNGGYVWPNQNDLSNDIDFFSINRNYVFGGTTLSQGTVTFFPSGLVSGSFEQLHNPDGTPANPAFFFTVSYHNTAGGTIPGPFTAQITIPPGGGNIVISNHSFFVP